MVKNKTQFFKAPESLVCNWVLLSDPMGFKPNSKTLTSSTQYLPPCSWKTPQVPQFRRVESFIIDEQSASSMVFWVLSLDVFLWHIMATAQKLNKHMGWFSLS